MLGPCTSLAYRLDTSLVPGAKATSSFSPAGPERGTCPVCPRSRTEGSVCLFCERWDVMFLENPVFCPKLMAVHSNIRHLDQNKVTFGDGEEGKDMSLL